MDVYFFDQLKQLKVLGKSIKMKNILMIVLSTYPQDPRVRREAEYLIQNNFLVDIICLKNSTQSSSEVYNNVKIYRILKSANKDSFLKYVLLSVLFSLKAFVVASYLTIKRRYNLVQIHNMPDYLVFTSIIPKILRIPILFDMHDLTVELFSNIWAKKIFLPIKWFVLLTEKLACKFSDKIITVSDGCKQRLIARGVPYDKISLVFNTANPEIFHFQNDKVLRRIDNNLRLIYHGTMKERIGIHIAIEAMYHVNKVIPATIFELFGKIDEKYKAELENIIIKYNLLNTVLINGSIPLEDCYKKILEADIGIIPYTDFDYSNIGLSNKAFEYASSGLPVVCSRLSELVKVFGEESFSFFEPENPDDLAAKILELCIDPELRKLRRDSAYKALESIGGYKMDEKYLSIVNELIKN